jgi:formate hydrogenlyase subunit 3/multisubunit Na+/H+ antiporter MnhD subunit
VGEGGLPPFAVFVGKGWIEDSAGLHALAWITAIMVICTVLASPARPPARCSWAGSCGTRRRLPLLRG